MTTAILHIALLGGMRITYGEQPCATTLHTVNTARLQALLGYLLLHRAAPQVRDHLAFLFWPDTTEAQALTNLRNLLHKLRQALPTPEQFLLVDSRSVQWRPDAPYALDVAAFEQAVAQATTSDALVNAVGLYAGELLPSCYDDWILPERERLRQLVLDALERLITLLEAQRDYRAAISYSQRLLQLEPLNEALYRRLMSLYAASEDRAGALYVYQRCVAMLQEEFAAEPAAATQELYLRLQRTEEAPALSGRRAPEQPALVGRAKEWQTMLATWQRTCQGKAHCLLLTGEAGIGKTRLAEELVAWVKRQGYGVAIAHCYAAEGNLALAPVLTWLRSEQIYQQLTTMEPLWLTEVARLLPELLTTEPAVATPGAMAAGWQRQRFFEALARALLHRQGPLLLVIDDLQWCDRETLEWLRYLVHFAQEHRVKGSKQAPQGYGHLLFLGTVRSEALSDNQPLATLLLTLHREDQVTEVTLGPLDQRETTALATAVGGQTLTAEQSAYLYQETEGNPLFVVEAVRADMAHSEIGVKADASNAYTFSSRATALDSPLGAQPHPLPPKVHAVIHTRLTALSPATRELAGVAATIGRAFPFAVLAQASQQAEKTLVCGLDELCQRQIVRERSADTYDFTHDKLREAAYNSLSAARRRLFHKQVAGALEAVNHHSNGPRGQPALNPVSGQIATHYELAGDYAKAIYYYQGAAAAAHQISANREAVRAYRRALTLAEGPSGLPPDATLYEKLGDLLQSMSQYEEACAVYTQALTYTTAMDAVQVARFHRKIGSSWRERYHYANAMQFYAASEAALEQAALPTPYRTAHDHLPNDHPRTIQWQAVSKETPAWWEEWLQTQLELDLVHYWLGEIEASNALQRRLQPLVEQHATLGQQAAFFQRRGQLEFRRQRQVATVEAVRCMQRSLALYQEAALQDNLPAAHFMLGFTLLWHDELAAAVEELQDTLHLAEQHGDLSLQARALTYLTIAARRREQVEAAQTFVTLALTVANNAHMPEYVALARANQAWLAWRRQDEEAVQEHGAAALALWQQLPATHASSPFQWTALWPLLATALHNQAVGTAVAYAHTLLDPHQQQLPDVLATSLTQALTAWATGDTAAALALLTEAAASAQQCRYL